jgi:hypothetical protein
VILTVLITLLSCQKEITNPFDPECPKETWTPTEFKVVQSENSLNLSWKQGNTNISGLKIDRKVGSQDWTQVASLGKTATTWTDPNITGGEVHQYLLYAFAGDYESNAASAQFTPVLPATLTTLTQSSVTASSAVLGGNITSEGGATVTERGIVYATALNPTTENTKITMGSGAGLYSQVVSGLSCSKTYYVKAYAINAAGTAYGNEIHFTTGTCAQKINLTITKSTLSSTSWSPGSIVSLSCIITATGLMISTISPYVGIYISLDNILSSRTDQLIYEKEAALSPTSPSQTISTKFTVPLTLPGGTYYILFVADNKGEYTESSETDNTESIKISI